MNRPRLFLSAVSEELRTARQAVSATVRTLGFDPVSQDDFPTGYGELRQWLREQLDSCKGLIQLVGQAYGAEPSEVDPEYGRVSYTQVEFLYARHQNKKTWVIVIGQDFGLDKPSAQLDLPRDAGHPDPTGYQAERRTLQQDYIARLTRENHLRHTANNKDQLEIIVLRLRDELGELRQQWEEWLQKDAILKDRTAARLDELAEASRLTTEKIRAHLLQTAEETHRRELSGAEADNDWKKRQQLREAADSAHRVRLSRIEELAASFAEIDGRGTVTSVFQEMTRILTEQGVDEAIAYVGTQRSSIFETVRARAATVRERNRADLQPLLRTAALHQAKGEASEAHSLYTDILVVEPDWPEVLHAAFWFLTDQGDLARLRTTLADARRDYAEAHRMAQRLMAGDPGNTDWQHDLSVSYDKLGDVAVAQGKLAEAAQAYGDSLAIRQQLTAGDPSNTQWQHNLSVSYEQLGRVALVQGKLAETAQAYGDSLTIRKTLPASDPSHTLRQRNLAVSYDTLGFVAVTQGKWAEAAQAYGDSLTIRKTLAASDPSHTQWQRDLAVSYDTLGDVAVAQGKWAEAAQAYGDSLAIGQQLAVSDPSNTLWQGDLSAYYDKFGNMAFAQGRLAEAAQAYGDSLAIRKALAVRDPSNTEWQRDLSVSNGNLGDVAMAQGKLDDAAQAYRDSLAIRKTLAVRDPSNTEWQRDLMVSYRKLADLAERQKNISEARTYWTHAFDVLSGIDKRGLHLSPEDRQVLETLRGKVSADAH
jgi:tetratricopeptide (TPR) repeat protein